jgi:plasmid maintenance system antidote protein VapI
MADKIAKRRHAHGESSGARRHPEKMPRGSSHWNSTLTEAQALQLKELYKGRSKGPTIESLAERFGVTRSAIQDVVKGRTWAHVTGIVSGAHDQRVRLSDASVAAIRAAYRGRGLTPTRFDLAKQYNVTHATISNIVTGKSRIDV